MGLTERHWGMTHQQQRLLWRSGFFLLFVLAPVLDLFRFDLNENHLVFLGRPWILETQAYLNGDISSARMAWNMALRFFLPLGLVIGGGVFIAWRWGRLYCGWLCPHFSVVEIINGLMRRATGRYSIWEKKPLPVRQLDGVTVEPRRSWWIVTVLAVLFFSFLWAVVLLTYLLPPREVYGNLFSGELTRNQALFIGVATFLLTIEFSLARHLFCRFGCAIGLFQSLVWMGNRRALVVSFNRRRARLCADCDSSCEHACPMRLKPRKNKRHMFTCTQCMQCIDACDRVQGSRGEAPLLKMLQDQCALDASARDFGQRPDVPEDCYRD
ncbi:MAG TPA: 4Fe-4S binding protein [Gammaproteobacteria bacterium]|nr:4Fe-4S binding protein [Gammaproteobacteria bacterium]